MYYANRPETWNRPEPRQVRPDMAKVATKKVGELYKGIAIWDSLHEAWRGVTEVDKNRAWMAAVGFKDGVGLKFEDGGFVAFPQDLEVPVSETGLLGWSSPQEEERHATSRIPLHGKSGIGLFAVVDNSDLSLVAHIKWRLRSKKSPYAVTNTGTRSNQSSISMHRVIMPRTPEVDHIDGNKLNNRRKNLRSSTRSQNMANTGLRRDNSSGYKGIWLNRKTWRASIRIDGRTVHLGGFTSAEAAARAYDTAAFVAFGDYARLNFPKKPVK